MDMILVILYLYLAMSILNLVSKIFELFDKKEGENENEKNNI